MAASVYAVLLSPVLHRLKNRVISTLSKGNGKSRFCSKPIPPPTSEQDKLRPFRPEIAEAGSLGDIGTRRIFTEEHDEFRRKARRFFHEEVVPDYEKSLRQGYADRELWRRAGELGLIGCETSTEYGGPGKDILYSAIVSEEQWYSNTTSPVISLTGDVIVPYFLKYGTREQIQRFFPDLVTGNCIAAIAMTEPSAGSDLQGMKTHAHQDGSDWILNGSKVFITNGHAADVIVVAALTSVDGENRTSAAHNMSLFLVDGDMPGFSRGRMLDKMGCRAEDTSELFFDDVRVPAENVLGNIGHGFYMMMENLPQERLMASARTIGHAAFMFEATRQHVKEATVGGCPLIKQQVTQHKLAELKTAICVGTAFFDQCLLVHHERGIDSNMAAMCKYWSTALQHQVAQECLTIHGAAGIAVSSPLARAFVDSRVQTIWAGSNEIMKNIIARPIAK